MHGLTCMKLPCFFFEFYLVGKVWYLSYQESQVCKRIDRAKTNCTCCVQACTRSYMCSCLVMLSPYNDKIRARIFT
jgi:hypothetical protein